MSANFDDDVSGPFDGGMDEHHETPRRPGPGRSGPGRGVPHREHALDDLDDYDDYPAVGKPEASGLEVVGGALFLAGCLPAAAVAKALFDGTNLAAPGLGGTAALAAKVSHWLGPWAALTTAAAIATLGALMVLGTLRTEPLRRVAGVMVAGLGLAAIMGALVPATAGDLLGGGGQIGLGTGGKLASSMGTWAGVLLGLAVMAGAIWLGFVQTSAEIDEDDGFGPIVERDEIPRSSAGSPVAALAKAAGAAATVGAAAAAAGASLFKRQPRTESEIIGNRSNRQRRVSNKKVRRPGAPVTLGDALARGGTEGVSHDEAAALAPDDKTLAYMEDVWRRASHSMGQPDPIPPSPYPEDVRLQGKIPDGAAPFEPRPSEPGQPQAPAPQSHSTSHYGGQPQGHQPPATPAADPYAAAPPAGYGATQYQPQPPLQGDEVAPFDFDDELSAPKPLNQASPPTVPLPAKPSFPPVAPVAPAAPEPLAADPFGASGAGGGLTAEESEAYKSAVLREGASATGPSDLPKGVKPFVPKPSEAEVVEAEAAAARVSSTESSSPSALSAKAEASAMDFTEVPGPSGMGTPVPGPGGVLFPAAEFPAEDGPIAKQAMQAGAMPASVSLPPRPAWEQGYDDEDDDAAELSADLLETIPDVDESGRWQRREDGSDEEVAQEEGEVVIPSMSVLDELLAQVEASEVALADSAVEAEPEVEAEIEAELADEVMPEDPVEVEADELPEEPEAAEETLDVDADEESELEEDEEDEDSEEAELEDGEEEEYEYVDEDGNLIDPADLGEEYEFVEEDEDDEEEDEEAEYEEYEDEEEDEEAAEAAEAEESDGEEDEADDEESEYEEYEDDEEYEEEAAEAPEAAEAEDSEAEDVDEEEPEDAEAAEDEGAQDVILEPQAPPTPETAKVEAIADPEAQADPEPSEEPQEAAVTLSGDGKRLLDAGRLVITKNRAAVSVIQKGFDVEFAEACSILEALFAEGLIGPYQEGKKRAILMSLEEWEGRFAHS